jgi:hypothetical protein
LVTGKFPENRYQFLVELVGFADNDCWFFHFYWVENIQTTFSTNTLL